MLKRKLSDFPNVTSWGSGPGALVQRTAHAAKIMEVIACVAQFDSMRGQILTEMIHSRAYYPLLIFEAISNQSVQDKVFKKIANEALSAEDHETLSKIEAKARALRECRNKFAHSVWGTSEQLPEDILCLPSNSFMDGAHLIGEREHIDHGWVDPRRIELINCHELDRIVGACRLAISAYRGFFYISYSQRNYSEPYRGFWSELGIDPANPARAAITAFLEMSLN